MEYLFYILTWFESLIQTTESNLQKFNYEYANQQFLHTSLCYIIINRKITFSIKKKNLQKI